jgi:hypothetical protein
MNKLKKILKLSTFGFVSIFFLGLLIFMIFQHLETKFLHHYFNQIHGRPTLENNTHPTKTNQEAKKRSPYL